METHLLAVVLVLLTTVLTTANTGSAGNVVQAEMVSVSAPGACNRMVCPPCWNFASTRTRKAGRSST